MTHLRHWNIRIMILDVPWRQENPGHNPAGLQYHEGAALPIHWRQAHNNVSNRFLEVFASLGSAGCADAEKLC